MAGDEWQGRTEAALPALTYQQIFTDPRLQTLIAQALVNNRDLMAAAANIAAAREQYIIQAVPHSGYKPRTRAAGFFPAWIESFALD